MTTKVRASSESCSRGYNKQAIEDQNRAKVPRACERSQNHYSLSPQATIQTALLDTSLRFTSVTKNAKYQLDIEYGHSGIHSAEIYGAERIVQDIS